MDLLDPASIDAFADRLLATGLPLHLLVNSAGIMAAPLTRDAGGSESQFATNHPVAGHDRHPAAAGRGGDRRCRRDRVPPRAVSP
jgi:NAD(P)-dependent dehydrogenase (short-subunit alcohol dehydrogenase family)